MNLGLLGCIQILASLTLAVGLLGCQTDEPYTDQVQQVSETNSELQGVRLTSNADTLPLLEEAAERAGWTEVRREGPESLVLIPPQPYDSTQFAALLDALESLEDQNFGLQLIGPDGDPIDGDGMPVAN